MCGLYDELANCSPKDWGAGTEMAAHSDAFRENFEEAFYNIVLTFNGGIPRGSALVLLEKQRPLALYFSRFALDSSGLDCYSRLFRSLHAAGAIQNSLFGSLNYDCLFEQAVQRCGYPIDYWSRRPESVRLAKLHCSCNFLTGELSQQDLAMLSAATAYEIGLESLPTDNLEATILRKLSDPIRRHFPIMSQTSPGKEDSLSPAQILRIRTAWAEALSTARKLAIIGVSYNQNDKHVVDAVRATPARIFYIGGESDSEKWKATNPNCDRIHGKFEDGLEALLQRLID